MIAGLAADMIVLVHLGFIMFFALGGFLVIKWHNIAFLHIPCALWGVLIAFGGWICPLTPLEMHFRQLAGQTGYDGGFIGHYVMQIAFGIILLSVNLCAYGKQQR